MKKLNLIKSSKLLIVLLSVLLVSLSGCTESRKVYGKRKGDFRLDIFTHNGVELECLFMGHGLSCNWEKYNKQKAN